MAMRESCRSRPRKTSYQRRSYSLENLLRRTRCARPHERSLALDPRQDLFPTVIADVLESHRQGLVEIDRLVEQVNGALGFPLLESLFASRSQLLLFPVQDVFGWSDRINTPATIGEHNWTFRLPWPSDRLDDEPEARERQAKLREWAGKYGRLGPA